MLIALFIVWVIIWLGSSFAFDNLIEYQYQNYREEWVKLGRPRGMFFNPKDASYLSLYIASFQLPHTKPDWIEEGSRAEELYGNYKIWGKVVKWYAIAFLPLVIVATSI